MKSIAERAAALPPDRLALLQRRLAENRKRSPAAERIARRAGKGSAPLSFGQERLWLIDQLQPGSPAYNIPAVLPLSEPLDVALLEGCLAEIVRRHEALRTTFRLDRDQVVQEVGAVPQLPLEVVDLKTAPDEPEAAALLRLYNAEFRRPFDLARGPLIRAVLVRLGATHAPPQNRLLLTLHHIVCDAWSLQLLFEEMRALYGACAAGLPPPLPELDLQYADFAEWQRGWLQGHRREELLTFWKQHLSGAPALLNLPTDMPRPAVSSFNGATQAVRLPPQTVAKLKSIGSELRATPFMTMLSIFAVLLHRYTAEIDLVIGTPIANRGRSELERLIGFFLNTLALRVDLSDDPPFTELLQRVREVTLAAFAHQDLPFEILVREVQPSRTLSVNPLFQVMFVLQSGQPGPAGAAGGPIESYHEATTGISRFDLTLALTETEGALDGIFEYSTDLFAAPTIERMAGHLCVLAQAVAERPDRRLSQLPLLTDREREALRTWNATDAPYPDHRCIHQLFEARAREVPQSAALVFGDVVLGYAELNRRANRLAHHLQGLGVGPESLVGLFVERSVEMVVGLLAILKAGGAYLPLDPSYPADRLAFMIADAEVGLVLTQHHLASRLPPGSWRCVEIDDDGSRFAGNAEADPAAGVVPDNAAYVIYTSGSTGWPKGVVVPHRGAVNAAQVEVQALAIRPADRILQFASLNFDASMFELLMWMWGGATLCLAAQDDILPGHALLRTIRANAVTVLPLPPSALAVVPVEPLDTLRIIAVMGEHCPAELVGRWRTGARRVFNAYGPTETSMWVAGTDLVGGRRTTIGRPIANNRIHILDAHMNPVPVGVTGEIHISGVGVARGYLRRAALTAERFLPDPFAQIPGSRLYRTGDLARYLPDGEIDFLGRNDHQVKVRGYRIELGEVEAVLRRHPAVRQAVVLALDQPQGAKTLAAYVAVSEPRPTQAELRQFLHRTLPSYAVPSSFTLLDALPLTPSGKIARDALPRPAPERTRADADVVPPDNRVEQMLGRIWAEALGIDRVGLDDNFFELGGHSLLAAQIASRVRDAFGIELSVRRIFDSPTLRSLAELIGGMPESKGAGDASPGGPHVAGLPAKDTITAPGQAASPVPAPGGGTAASRYPLSHSQERIWFLDQMQPGNPAYNIPIRLPIAEPVDLAAIERALTEAVRRHESLRTTFGVADGIPVQMVGPVVPFMLPVVDLRSVPADHRGRVVEDMAAAEARRPFDLARGPLIRAVLVKPDDQWSLLLLTVHHIVSDGWSMAVLAQELAALNAAFRAGHPSPLAEPALQYRDYVAWQRAYLQGGVLEELSSYWRKQLADAPPLQLPIDRPRVATPSYAGAQRRFVIAARVADRLRLIGQSRGATMFVVLLAAFKVLLRRYCGQDDIVVGTAVANRNRSEHERLVGLFANSLALRTDLSDEPNFPTLVERVGRVMLDALAHQDMPFERIVAELISERVPGVNPIFQAFFGYHGGPKEVAGEIQGGGPPSAHEQSATKFDLSLHVMETAGEIIGGIEYNIAVFDAATIDRIVESFTTLIEAIAADPDRPIGELAVLAPHERQQLRAWNATAVEWVREAPLHEWIEAQAAATPHLAAVIFGEEVVSYAALDARAERLAKRLREAGVGPEVRVGIYMNRCTELVVGLLAILKAGGAYVPLDSADPPERLAYIASDARLAVLLTAGNLPAINADPAPAVMTLDREEGAGAPRCAGSAGEAGPDNVAYVIYTSGSTGRPKGVMVSHRAVVNRLLWMQSAYRLTSRDRVLQKTPCSFDVSVWEFFWPLMTGATLVLAAPQGQRDSAYLVRLIREQQITHIHFVPSMLDIFLDEPGVTELPSLKRVICSGEALSSELQARVFSRMSAELHNLYGPTEVAVDVTAWRCERHWSGQTVPIGRPVANTTIHILDGALNPVPIGVAGELYLGGVQLARGYFGQPGLTAERFIPNAFDEAPGARLYKTGDLARYAPDGTIEFLGRIDRQIKIRGFRVEPGEIEATLDGHPSVRESIVVMQARQRTDPMLVAYVQPAGGRSVDAALLRTFLSERLPPYMVPAIFTPIDAVPLTASGKRDLKSLLLPDAPGPMSDRGFVAPRHAVDRIVAEIWKDVLGLQPIGAQDDFFQLGGHSLQVIRVLSRLRDLLGVELPVAQFFGAPTVARLAALIVREHDPDGRLATRAEAAAGGLSGGYIERTDAALPIARPCEVSP